MSSSWKLCGKASLLLALILSPFFSPAPFSIACFPKNAPSCNKSSFSCLKQPFFYLGQGKQCIAFLGQDGSTVLKVFQKNHSQEVLFQSADIAYQMLKQETALLGIHLQQDSLKEEVLLFDLSGKPHKLCLSKTPFLLQKKMPLFFPLLKEELVKNNHRAAEQMIASLVQTLSSLYDRGINDRDYALRRNIGFLEGKTIFLDIGSFSYDPHVKECKAAILRQKTARLCRFLQKHAPAYLPYYEETLNSEIL